MTEDTAINMRLTELEKRQLDIECKYNDLNIKISDLGSNVTHIKGRIDDGMSRTIEKILDQITAMNFSIIEMTGKMKDTSYWVEIWKKIIIYLAIMGIIVLGIFILKWLMPSGLKIL